MSPGMAPTHVSHPPQFTSGHPSMMPPSSGLYSPHSGPYGPMPPMPGQEIPPSNLGTYSLAVIQDVLVRDCFKSALLTLHC